MFLWLKAFHIIFVVCWFAGIFYLPRLFVYHAMSEHPESKQQFRIMERKLYRFVTPFALLTLVFGLAMAYMNWEYYRQSGWFHAKVTLVLLLFAYHIACGYWVKKLATSDELPSHVFFRVFNEIPVLMLFAIVILAVVKPF